MSDILEKLQRKIDGIKELNVNAVFFSEEVQEIMDIISRQEKELQLAACMIKDLQGESSAYQRGLEQGLLSGAGDFAKVKKISEDCLAGHGEYRWLTPGEWQNREEAGNCQDQDIVACLESSVDLDSLRKWWDETLDATTALGWGRSTRGHLAFFSQDKK